MRLHLALLRLFLGRLGQYDAASRNLLGLIWFNNEPISKRFEIE